MAAPTAPETFAGALTADIGVVISIRGPAAPSM
jgi:hypothetical protein